MTTLKKLTFLLFALSFSFAVSAQEEEAAEMEETATGPHHIGLHAGSTTGLGFSYRYWPSKWGLQVTGVPVFNQGGSSFVSVGASALYLLQDNQTLDLYGYLGNHLILNTNQISVFDSNTNTFTTTSVTQEIYNLGLGLGIRARLLDNLNLNLQAGYGFYDITGNIFTNLAGEAGLYYQF